MIFEVDKYGPISCVKFWIGNEDQYGEWANADPEASVDKPRHTHMMQASDAERFVTGWLEGPPGPAGPAGMPGMRGRDADAVS